MPEVPFHERENISIAFKNSNYPTKYGDSSIPGNHPGYRLKTMGRDYAPQPLTRSHMTVALVVPYSGNGDNTKGSPAGDGYVLNVKNGGKRHFEEERAMEKPWRPTKAYAESPSGAARYRPHGKGRGVYNFEESTHPDAIEALAAREKFEGLDGKVKRGKAQVDRAPDHSVVQLGLWHGIGGGGVTSSPRKEQVRLSEGGATVTAAASPALGGDGAPLSSSAATGAPAVAATSSAQRAAAVNGFVFSCGYVNEATGIGSNPYLGAERPDECSDDHLHARQVRENLRSTRRAQTTCVRDREDIAAVRSLPEW